MVGGWGGEGGDGGRGWGQVAFLALPCPQLKPLGETTAAEQLTCRAKHAKASEVQTTAAFNSRAPDYRDRQYCHKSLQSIKTSAS